MQLVFNSQPVTGRVPGAPSIAYFAMGGIPPPAKTQANFLVNTLEPQKFTYPTLTKQHKSEK
jgi:hypothetical protein